MNLGYPDFKYIYESAPISLYGSDRYFVQRKDNFYRLGISLSRSCNLACRHCYYQHGSDAYKAVDMPISQLRSILYHLPKLASINFGLEGEPFICPHIFDALSLAADKTEAIMLVTNGTLLTDETIKELCYYPITNVVLSTEGATKKSYEIFRTGSSFLRFCKNAAKLANEFGNIVSLHATIFKENLQNLLKLPILAASIGIKNISLQQLRINPAIMMRGITSVEKVDLLHFLQRIIEIADNNRIFLNFDQFFGSSDIMHFLTSISTCMVKVNKPLNRTHVCPVVFQCTSILADGTIFPCCGDFRPATIKKYSFDGIFNHPYLLKLRFLTQNGHTPYQCMVCHHETRAHNAKSIDGIRF